MLKLSNKSIIDLNCIAIENEKIDLMRQGCEALSLQDHRRFGDEKMTFTGLHRIIPLPFNFLLNYLLIRGFVQFLRPGELLGHQDFIRIL